MDYEERCSILKWSPLKNRRLYFSLIECYKCIFSSSNLEFQDFFQLASKRTRSNHNYKLKFQASSCNCYKYSYFVRIVKEWNDLPEWIVGAGNLACFKRSFRIIFKYFVVFSFYSILASFLATFLDVHFQHYILILEYFKDFSFGIFYIRPTSLTPFSKHSLYIFIFVFKCFE